MLGAKMKVVNNSGGFIQGKIVVAFIKNTTEDQANLIVESAGYKLESYSGSLLGRVICPVGKEHQAIMALTTPGVSQAGRLMKHMV